MRAPLVLGFWCCGATFAVSYLVILDARDREERESWPPSALTIEIAQGSDGELDEDRSVNSLLVTLKNNGSEPLRVLKPLRESELFRIQVKDLKGRSVLDPVIVECPPICGLCFPDDEDDGLITIPTGAAIHCKLPLDRAIVASGAYSLTAEYHFDYRLVIRRDYPPNLWQGKVRSKEVTLHLNETR